jgi:putative endonuclease
MLLKGRRARTKEYYVYIMANLAHTIYIGVTNNIESRVYQHKNKLIPGFTTRYGLNMLVYYESTSEIDAAIGREKQLKGWRRDRKVALIQSMNHEWRDLSLDFMEE